MNWRGVDAEMAELNAKGWMLGDAFALGLLDSGVLAPDHFTEPGPYHVTGAQADGLYHVTGCEFGTMARLSRNQIRRWLAHMGARGPF